MTVYIVIEQVDVEVISVTSFLSLADADIHFDKVAEENLVLDQNVINELKGTLRIAGYHPYWVSLIQSEAS